MDNLSIVKLYEKGYRELVKGAQKFLKAGGYSNCAGLLSMYVIGDKVQFQFNRQFYVDGLVVVYDKYIADRLPISVNLTEEICGK